MLPKGTGLPTLLAHRGAEAGREVREHHEHRLPVTLLDLVDRVVIRTDARLLGELLLQPRHGAPGNVQEDVTRDGGPVGVERDSAVNALHLYIPSVTIVYEDGVTVICYNDKNPTLTDIQGNFLIIT